MTTSPTDSQRHLPVLAIILGAIVSVSVSQGLSTAWDTMVGLIMIGCLKSYGPTPPFARSQAGLLAMAWAFSILLIASPGIDLVFLLFLEQPTLKWHQVFQNDMPLDIRHLIHIGTWAFVSVVIYVARFKAHESKL